MSKLQELEYETIIKNDDPIVRDHRVHGMRIMPGVTFISIIYNILNEEGLDPSQFVLKDILFQEAITTSEEYERKIKINISDVDGLMKAEIFSKKVKDEIYIDTEWTKHFECIIFYEQQSRSKKIDIETLKESALYCESMDIAYKHARDFDIRHYDFMKSLGSLYRNNEWIMGEICLGNLALEYLPNFLVHPVYLDSATLLPAFYSFKNPEYYNLDFSESRPSIPIYINSFKLYEKLDKLCYVFVRKSDIKIYSDDIMYANIEIYNKDGKLISLIDNLAYKKIRSSDLITNIKPIDYHIEKEVPQNVKVNKKILKEETTSTASISKIADIKSLVEEDIKKIIEQVFDKSYTKINIDDGFYDMGLDSGDLLKFVKILENKISKQLYPTLLFEYTNISKLSEYLADNFGDQYRFEIQDHQNDANEKEFSCDLLYYSSEFVEREIEDLKQNLYEDEFTILITDDNKLKYEFEEKMGNRSFTVIPQEFEYSDSKEHTLVISKLEDSLNNILDEIIYKKIVNIIIKLDSIIDKECIYFLVEFTKFIMKLNLKGKLHIMYLFKNTNNKDSIFSKSLVGFTKSVQLENPNIYYHIVGIDKQEYDLVSIIFNELNCFHMPDMEINYSNGKRYVLSNYRYHSLEKRDKQTVLKNDGVYIITGGMGGLGIIIAKYLLEKYQAKVILAGRTQLNDNIKEKILELNMFGGNVSYIQADVSIENDVKSLITEVKSLFGVINGIIHCAGINLDSYIINKKQNIVEQVLRPKIEGCINLDNVTAEETLDFFLLFSSLSAITGNAGQSDYAYANNFLCRFAHYREQLREKAYRYGKSIVINWPLWEDGGMKVSNEIVSDMKRQSGIVPLSSKDGLAALDAILRSGKTEITVVNGDIKTIDKSLNVNSFDSKNAESKAIIHYENKNCEVDDFAIIGIDVRFPKSSNLDEFWENLINGRDCIEEIPKDRWDWREYFSNEKEKGIYSKWGGFIENMQYFDADFFGISREEAVFMDPQERIFLETVWHVLEDAGYTRENVNQERVGVFVGAMYSQYQLIGTNTKKNGTENVSGAGLSSIANRVSYHMDFKGPSIVVDTACSSSLEAIKLACNFMKLNECELAIAGGVNLTIHPSKYQLLCQAGYLSSYGRCKCFGAGGDGYVPGEGVGAVLLKPLTKAIADGDHIYGVIKGIETNHVGKTNGYSVPNPQMEADLIFDTLLKSKINADSISYIEAHSTGTEIGDLIEITGLKKTFERYTNEKQFCAIGSVKSNIGHLEAASGMASLAKVLLQMKYKTIVPSIHCYPMNPSINFKESPFYVADKLINWQQKKSEETDKWIPRRAGISVFGAGGSNVHMIVEEYNDSENSQEIIECVPIFVLSAKSETALYTYAKQMLQFFKKIKGETNDKLFNNALYTLQVGREEMEYRAAFFASNINEVIKKLESFSKINNSNEIFIGRITKAKSNISTKHDIKSLLHHKKYEKLMMLWIEGQSIDWNITDKRNKRISMPNYPFQRDYYWAADKNITLKEDAIVQKPSIESIETLEKKLQTQIITIVSELINVSEDEVDVYSEMSEFGFDSVTIVSLTTNINNSFNIDITPAVFFEHRNIDSLVKFILNNYKNQIEEVKQTDLLQDGMENFLKVENMKHDSYDNECIAIIGVSAVMPQSEDKEVFWDNISEGKNLVTEVPKNRWDWEKYYGDPNKANNVTNIKYGGFMKEVDKFDPLFFGISPVEAELMDPQQRIFLENVWNVIEDAGYKASELAGLNVGVYVGVGTHDYNELLTRDGQILNPYSATGSAHSVLANRVSYLFDFHGPSEPVDTACSSALVSIHHAVEALQSGTCELAIAGGVNVLLTPTLYISFGKGGMLSQDGKCKAFDKSADGYVRGEGAGAVLLKPLKKAVEDGDYIYAVIKGTSINHGGKVNTLTAPNPNAQAKLIEDTWEKSKIDPSQISYIETHGTGTSLGDPIEINGLKKAYKSFNKKHNLETVQNKICGLASVKTNIGHLEAAAGIAGLVKILMAMKYKYLPPNIHFKEKNPYIQLEESPFYIIEKGINWEALKDADGKEIPRLAGISSFGFGGVNAHIILEEYIKNNTKIEKFQGKNIIILSAHTEKQLKEYAVKIKNYIEKQILKNKNHEYFLNEIAFSLQTGREEMEYRLAFVVETIENLIEKLEEFIEEKHNEEIYTGFVNNSKNEEVENIDVQNPHNVAISWVQGKKIYWKQLYQGKKVNKIPLPTYPFDKKRCWLQYNNINEAEKFKKLHLFLDENVSTLDEQCFKKSFSKEEIFISNHIIGNKAVVPAAVFIEMARAACEKSLYGCRVNNIKNIKWLRPLIIDEDKKDVFIRIYPQKSEIKFEIGTKTEQDAFITYVEGTVLVNLQNKLDKKLDIMNLRKNCCNRISKEECYEYFEQAGIHYGNAFKSIKELYTGENEVFCCIENPVEDIKNIDGLLLYPSILDGALQSVVGINGMNLNNSNKYLPYSIENLLIGEKFYTNCYVYAKLIKTDIDNKMYNIYIMDDDGNILAELLNFTTQIVRSNVFKSIEEKCDYICYKQTWKEKTLPVHRDILLGEDNVLIFDTDLKLFNSLKMQLKDRSNKIICVLKGDNFKQIEENIFEINPLIEEHYTQLLSIIFDNNISMIIHLWSKYDEVSDLYFSNDILYNSIFSVFLFTKNFVKRSKKKELVFLYFYNIDSKVYPYYESVSNFGKSLQQENPNIKFKTVGIESNKIEPDVLNDIISCEKDSANLIQQEVKYNGTCRYVKELEELHVQNIEEISKKNMIKKGAAYLVTGGCGGVGFIIARYLAKKYNAKLILCGRTVIDDRIQNKLEEITALGGEGIYVNADISTKEGADYVVRSGKDYFGKINGLIHCAGSIKDAFIENKTLQDFKDVIMTKVAGTIHLDKALSMENMDIMILCSSISGIFGNIGQTDYSYANGFLDAFAGYMNRIKQNTKVISIQWPLWDELGMTISEEQKEVLFRNYGLVPMKKEIGIKNLELAASINADTMAVFYGEKEHIIAEIESINNVDIKIKTNKIERDIDKKKLIKYLAKIFSQKTKVPISAIKANDYFEKYGIDSMLIMELNRELEKVFGRLSKTIFFEYQTIDELSNYFIENHPEKVEKILETDFMEKNHNFIKEENYYSEKSIILENRNKERFIRDTSKVNYANEVEEEIAIIGVSGRYPEAENLEEFWENLKAGKDCITTLPKERWDGYGIKGLENSCGGFLKNIDKFDPLFFNISPKEASMIDPQERLFLETVWHTLEDAGYKKCELEKSKTGVFVGVMYGQYQLLGIEETAKGNPLAISSFYASIANRVSYFYNFSGPSIAVDTMCSSSLTAIHLACDSLRKGESNMAIAGGVNISIHPSKYMVLGQTGFISKQGKCQSFGANGDGYIPGEGVGAVLLKPLRRAVEDGDRIYAVIKSSTINHGGKTNGYSVPNPNAQTELIIEALNKANISPETIQYIEAHGTGTPLGDPIEISGLTKAMRKFTQKKQFCAIGSVKSNIGHLESAAGIASITKVLLQMKYETLVPSIHTEVLNPNIDFEDTPFYVQKEVQPWKQNTDKDIMEMGNAPRRAAVSSFGAGGANAHVILEEYPQNFAENTIEKQQYIVPISAKNSERLKEYCKVILNYISSKKELLIKDIAYTLSIGREEMEERVIFLVSGIDEFKEKLSAFLKDEGQENVYSGNIYKNKNIFSSILGDEDGTHIIDNWHREKNILKLASVWINGMIVDWKSIYSDKIYNKICMPGYPFEEESCWITRVTKTVNKSNFSEWIDKVDYLQSIENGLTFKKTFYLKDLLVNEHRVLGECVIAGVVGIQLVRSALKLINNKDNMILNNIVWLKPIKVDKDIKEISVRIRSSNQGMEFSVNSYESNKEIVHIKGEAITNNESSLPGTQVDLEEFKQCFNTRISKQELYEYFEKSGLSYGDNYQVLEEILVNENEAFGTIQLRNSNQDSDIDPILLDGALQTMAAVYFNKKDSSSETSIPYQLEEIEVLADIKNKAYSYVKLCEKDQFNIAIFNENGILCVKMIGLVVKKINVLPKKIFYMPIWKERPFITDTNIRIQKKRVVIYTEESIELKDKLKQYLTNNIVEIRLDKENLYIEQDKYDVNDNSEDALKACIQKLGDIEELYFLSGIHKKVYIEDDLDELNYTQKFGVFSLFKLIKALEREQYIDIKIITNGVYSISGNDMVNPYAASIIGLARAAVKEYPNMKMSLIDINLSDINENQLIENIVNEPFEKNPLEVAFRQNKRYERVLKKAEINKNIKMSFRKHGVYMIIGGAGGIGLEMSIYLARRFQAKVILVGRSKLTIAKQQKLEQIKTAGGEVLYLQADVSSIEEMNKAVQFAEEKFQMLNGVIHSAIVLNDGAIENMQEETIQKVFKPKVIGSVVLHKVLKNRKLDFMVYFSSAQSFNPAAGQSNYASASRFEDAVAEYYSSESYPTWIINWGYWGTVGVVASEKYREKLAAGGLYPLEVQEGMEAVMQIVGNNVQQVMVIKGTNDFLKYMGVDQESTPINETYKTNLKKQEIKVIDQVPLLKNKENEEQKYIENKNSKLASDINIKNFVEETITSAITTVLGVKKKNIDTSKQFSDYGVDSITGLDLIKYINDELSLSLRTTIIFDYANVEKLTQYIVEQYRDNILIKIQYKEDRE